MEVTPSRGRTEPGADENLRAPLRGKNESDPAAKVGDDETDFGEEMGFNVDVYNAVVVAAFGGVTQRLSKTEKLFVHPGVLFLLSFGLVCGQLTAIIFLRLDADFDVPVWSNSTYRSGEHDVNIPLGEYRPFSERSTRTQLLMTLKLLMVFVVQMVQFDRLIKSMRMLTFLLNPTTWVEFYRPKLDGEMRFGWIYHQAILSPLAITAKILQVLVDYIICVDAVSIILAGSDCKEVIYDSLAITFIADLGSTFWAVVMTVFHIDDFRDYKFRPVSIEDKKERQQRSVVPAWVTDSMWLSHGQGGHAGKLEIFVTFSIAGWCFYRQVVIVAFALKSDILPVARDVCTFWRWDEHEANNMKFLSFLWRMIEAHVLLHDPADAIKHIADPTQGGYCEGKYNDRMHVRDEANIIWEHPAILWIFVVLLLPQIFVLFNKTLRRALCYKDLEHHIGHEEDLAPDDDPNALQESVRNLHEKVRLLEEARRPDGSSPSNDSEATVMALKGQMDTMRCDLQAAHDVIKNLQAKLETMEGKLQAKSSSSPFKIWRK